MRKLLLAIVALGMFFVGSSVAPVVTPDTSSVSVTTIQSAETPAPGFIGVESVPTPPTLTAPVYVAPVAPRTVPRPASPPRVATTARVCYYAILEFTANYPTIHHDYYKGDRVTALECTPIMANGILAWTTISDVIPANAPVRVVRYE